MNSATLIKNVLFLLLTTLFFLPTGAIAFPADVVFNELAWMGRSQPYSSNDEWIELHNNADSDIDLNGWRIVSDDNTPNIVLSGIVSGQGFYLLERTNDQTIPEIIASQIYTGALENSGENLKLIDKNGVLIDEIRIDGSWPAGDSSSKQTMERTSLGAWVTSQEIHGTPGQENSVDLSEIPITSFLPEPTATTSPEPAQGIIFSEILPSPLGPDENEEWIEIYNQNDFDVSLSGWQIQDSFGQTKTYSFPADSVITANSYLIIKRLDSKITLNNQEDKLLIINPNQEVVDSVHYAKAVSNQSFARFADDWAWTSKLTPAMPNISGEEENDSIKKQEQIPVSANVSQSSFGETENNNPWFLRVLITATTIAALSGIAILMLKRLIGGINNP